MLDFILRLHLLTYYQVLVVGSVTTVRGVLILQRHEPFTDGFRSLLYITAGTGILQALLGGFLYLGGLRPDNMLHLVYGGIVVCAIPLAYAYISEEETRRDIAVLAFATFALVAAALRAFATGAH